MTTSLQRPAMLEPPTQPALELSPAEAVASCRSGCGACCIAPSISSPIPGMPQGKPAGVRCVQLDVQARCRLFGRPERPQVCASLRPSPAMCGPGPAHALRWLARLEDQTAPGATPGATPGAAPGTAPGTAPSF